jgi:Family of unknown function (DUF6286)
MRVVNRPLALILAAALLAGSVIVIAEVIGFAVDNSPLLVPWPTWYHWASTTSWDAMVVQVWAAVLMAVGLVLVVLEVKRRRRTRLPLGSADQATDATVTRRGLARMLRMEAARVDGITGARARVSRKRARVTASSSARGRAAASALTEPVTRALDARIDGLEMRHAPELSVRVVPGGR